MIAPIWRRTALESLTATTGKSYVNVDFNGDSTLNGPRPTTSRDASAPVEEGSSTWRAALHESGRAVERVRAVRDRRHGARREGQMGDRRGARAAQSTSIVIVF